eukprot:10957981-Ditylum_brightwellii.AAC.1
MAVKLLEFMGVGCGKCPISLRATCIGRACCASRNMLASSASATEVAMCFMILHTVWTALFSKIGLLSCGMIPRK